MAFSEQNSQAAIDSINMSEKKDINVSVEPVPSPSPLSSKSPTDQLVSREPEKLEVSRLYEFAMLMYDIFLCLLTLALVVKTTLCIISYKINYRQWVGILTTPVDMGSPLTSFLQVLNAQIVTAFTIVFVTVMTTVTRRYALWKAQRGAYVSELEQMCGSTSLPSTIKMVFVLRRFTLTSLSLVALWSFYYLGSQASSREYVHAPSGPRHLVEGAVPGDSVFFDFAKPYDMSSINAQFQVNGVLDLQTGLDLRGFLLVPDMRQTHLNITTFRKRTEEELHTWMTVESSMLVPQAYTGYAGRKAYFNSDKLLGDHSDSANDSEPTSWSYIGTLDGNEGLPVVGGYTFTTSFINVDCDSAQALGLNGMPPGTAETTNASFALSSLSGSTPGPFYSENLDVYYRYDEQNAPKTVMGGNPGVLRVHCTITRPHVEIVAMCPAGGCLASKIRYLSTFASNPFTNMTWSKGFFDNLLGALSDNTITVMANGTDLRYELETNIFGPPMFSDDGMTQILTDYSSSILQQLNTYFNLADQETYAPKMDASYTKILMSLAQYSPQYRLIWPWVILDYISTAILFIASIASIWLRKHTLAPDIFGYVSSLTRDNPHVPVMEGGSSLSGIDRARAMGKVKIKIADIGGEEDGVGRVGVVYLHENVNAQSLSKNRVYV